MSLPTLPKWGCLQDGELCEQPTPERPTVASDSSSSLPTPTARDVKEQTLGWTWERDGKVQKDTLPRAVTSLLPTPVADNSRGLAQSGTDFQSLPNAAISLLPTPTVMDMGSNYTPEEWQVWKAQQRAAHQNGNGHGASLTQEALTLLPTPTAQAAKHGETPDTTANSYGFNLWDIPTLLPTPTATDVGKHAGQPRHKRVGHQARIADVIEYLPQWNGVNPLLPTPLAQMGGASPSWSPNLAVLTTDPKFALGVDTAQPSADGSRSAADPRQIQLFPAPTAGHA